MQDGLTQNSTGFLLKDSRGFLWIGTSWGLNRYDGRTVKPYTKIGKEFLPDLAINSIAEDGDGDIWIATINGLSCMDPFTEKFTNYFEGTGPQTIPHDYCNVYVDKQKNIWVADSYGISLLNKQSKTLTTYPITTAGRDIRINKYVSRFYEDSKGRLWLTTSYGIKLFDRATKTYRSFHIDDSEEESIGKNATLGIFEDRAGTIWAGTWNHGLLKLNTEKNKFENILLTGFEIPEYLNNIHDINSIILNGHYYLLITTGAGLFLADPENAGADTFPIVKKIDDPDVIDDHTAGAKNMILKDGQNIYWISGTPGLVKIDLSNQAFQWKLLPGPSSTHNRAFHIIPDIEQPQQKFFVTTFKGWWKYDLTLDSLSEYILPKGSEKLLMNINRFLPTEKGYWFTSQWGFGFYNTKTGEVKDLSLLVLEKPGMIVRTRYICEDRMGRIWFSVYRSGIRIYDPQTGVMKAFLSDSTKPGNLYGKDIFDMKTDDDGSVIFTTGQKIYKVNPTDLTWQDSSPFKTDFSSIGRVGPRKIIFDKRKRTVVLSMQNIYQYQHNKLIPLYPLDGVASFLMDDFVEDRNGNFWILTNIGLFKTDADFKEWTNMRDKIPIDDPSDISELFKTDNDEFIIPVTGKFGVFSVPLLSRNNMAPSVIINRLRTGNTEHYNVSLRKQSWHASFKEAIEIEISAIGVSNERGNKIYYKLEGRDKDWKELIGLPVIRYEQLPPDNYLFKSKAMNGDGVWSKETVLSFKVLPPFWRTTWFIALCILAIAGILYAFYRYRVQLLIKQERLRSSIATDLHDDIGATLSSISIYSETIKQQTTAQLPQLTPMLDKMGETSREMVGNMSDIVWAINPENDSFEKMSGRMQNLAAELCSVKNIQLQFTAEETLDQLQLSMEQRRNIYLIFKEALNNALKYSICRNIKIDLRKDNRWLVLSVQDDGKGFNEALVAENKWGGNGLKNMRHRAKEINGELMIETEENKGTLILFKTLIT